MTRLVPLEFRIALFLSDVSPVPSCRLTLAEALGRVLAKDMTLPRDLPVQSQALRAGVAVAALETVGASPHLPLPLGATARVKPGDALPAGADAVQPDEGLEWIGGTPHAIRALSPGDGIRRTGHDGRAGQIIARQGERLGPIAALLAAEADILAVETRRPRVQVALDNPAHADFCGRWARAHGATLSSEAPHLLVRTGHDHTPRLALTGAETAWLHRQGETLVLDLPPRFDGLVAGLLALGLPVLAALAGATQRRVTLPLLRKAASAPGMSDLVLLTAQPGGWQPAAPGLITITSLAQADAFAILPPDSEGLSAGSPLEATPIFADRSDMP